MGKGGKWLSKTKVGKWGGDALEALGKTDAARWGGDALKWVGNKGDDAAQWLGNTRMGQMGGNALEWMGKRGDDATQWLGKQGNRGVEYLERQRQGVIRFGRNAFEGAGKLGDEMLGQWDELLSGGNKLELAGAQGRMKSSLDAPPGVKPEAADLKGFEGGADARRVMNDPEAMETLADTAPKQRLSELSSKELDGELELAGDLPRKSINEPPYVEEVELPNGHEWKRKEDGTWCRFSEPKGDNCVPPGTKELPEPLNLKSLVIDSNIAIALEKKAKGLKLQAGEQASLDSLTAMGDVELRVADTTIAEVQGGQIKFKGLPVSIARDTNEYKALLRELEGNAVGRSKGAADRSIVADTFFAETEPGVTPQFATRDKGIYNALLRIAGVDPAKLGKTVPEAFPNGFTVTINGRTIQVMPIPNK